jgi:sulfotransferase family protein
MRQIPPTSSERAPLRRGAPSAADRLVFVLVSTRRSGSTWAADMLGSHPEVTCHGELFMPKGRGAQPPLRVDTPFFFDTLPRRRRFAFGRVVAGWRYADRVFRAPGTRAVGCKVAYGHLKGVPWLLAYLKLNDASVVHLVRRNKLAHLLSMESAKARGRYHALVGERVESEPVRLEARTLVAALEKEERMVRRARWLLARLGLPTLEVAYEDLLADPEQFKTLLDFLGVDPDACQLRSKLQKWNRRGFRDAIANYDEVKATLQDTKYLALLESSAGSV